MISVTVVFTQAQGEGRAAAPAAPARPATPTAAEIREQIQKSIEAARAGGQQRITVAPGRVFIGPDAPGEPGIFVNPRDLNNVIPPQAVDISIAFFIMCAVMVVGWPIARAFGRRIERRGQVTTLDAGTVEQLQRIEQAVDAMAIEVERISESQRFMARLQRDGSAHPLPSMESR